MVNVNFLEDNLLFLVKEKYLTNKDIGLLTILSFFVEKETNMLIKKEKEYQMFGLSEIASISYLARKMRKNGQNDSNRAIISRNISSLIEKGIILEIKDKHDIENHQRMVSERPLFLNPELIYVGDTNKINHELSKLLLNNDYMKNNNIELPWKLEIDSRTGYGKLVQR